MSDERNAHGRLRPDILIKNDWVAKTYGQLPVDVLNVSSHDLRYFAESLSKTDSARRNETIPLLRRIVGANILAESPNMVSPRPFIVREVSSRQGGAKSIRVAFIGLTETKPSPPVGFRFTDPAEAARTTSVEARKNADLVVALAKLSVAEADRVARAAPGIDVIIAGNAESLLESFTPPHYVGQTLVVFTPFETRMIGELRFYRGEQGKFTTKQRFITLDETSVPEDAATKQLVDAATAAESQARSNSIKLLEHGLASSGPTGQRDDLRSGDSPATYVTSLACSQCHAAQYLKWANSAHARATDALPPRAAEFEISCLNCHATGSTPQAAGAKLQSVQCEQCHGPGSKHVTNPGKGYGRIPQMQTTCSNCHSAEISLGFDLKVAWEQIKH
jgi:2',3'-cyclic-nucleotide 2'-phosphodiesterase (5'-nucleotidase family)